MKNPDVTEKLASVAASAPASGSVSAWKWFNRSAILLQIWMLAYSSWHHEWQWSIFWSFLIVGNAWHHWKTLND